MKTDELSFAPAHGWRGTGDLYLPEQAAGAPLALVIHGGGWQAMDKTGLAGVAAWLTAQGWAAFANNYRLLGEAPWPACGDDCLAAAHYLLTTPEPAIAQLARQRLLIVGGSAGGHLAMWTGLRLPRPQVHGIVSIAGPFDLGVFAHSGNPSFPPPFWEQFFGPGRAVTDALLQAASPAALVVRNPPPLLCLHSRNDELVPPVHADLAAAAWQAQGGRVRVYRFSSPDKAHGIWRDYQTDRRLLPELEDECARFLQELKHEENGR